MPQVYKTSIMFVMCLWFGMLGAVTGYQVYKGDASMWYYMDCWFGAGAVAGLGALYEEHKATMPGWSELFKKLKERLPTFNQH